MNNKNNYNPSNDDISLDLIIIKLWNEKIIIILTCLFCLIIGIFFSTTQNKDIEFTAHVKVNYPNQTPFLPYSKIFQSSEFADLLSEDTLLTYNKLFNKELFSVDNLVEFAIQNKKIDLFKEYLNKKDITIKKYFAKDKFSRVFDFKNNEIPDIFSLTFSETLDGEVFLDEYIIYTKNKSIKLHLIDIHSIINDILTHYKYNLEIAENIDLEIPLIVDNVGAKKLKFYEGQIDLYHRGYKVLRQQYNYIKNFNEMIKEETFDYNPILDKSIIVSSNSKNILIYPLLSVIFGFILSFIIIYLRTIFGKRQL